MTESTVVYGPVNTWFSHWDMNADAKVAVWLA